ncbi:right-handed parallel beta-helix repeat-containing protein [Peribacillus frigoritolerans]|uniref:hypothetical protein n=1 Tax=Peribacillus castrilensis TaxID=2897690 RepID=UPI003DA2F1FD
MNLSKTDARMVLDQDGINISEKIGNLNERLVDTAKKTNGWINLAEYPLIVPETTDSPRIQRALNDLVDGDELILSGGQVNINQPIKLKTKNVKITVHKKFTIKAVSAMDACIKLEAVNVETIQYGIELENITVDGNGLANHCLLIEDTVGKYIAEIRVLNCKFSKALLDGIKVGAPAWVIKFNKCNAEYNGRDGIRVATNGSKQVNAVHIIDCVLSGNTGNGISMNGISNLIKGNVIERNFYGICIDPAVDTSPDPNNAFKITIEGNYMELNKQAEIFIKSYKSGQVNGVSIKDNYFWSNVVGGTGTLIKCQGSLGFISNLRLEGNLFQSDGVNVTKYFDGGGSLVADSDVGVVENPSRYVNLGLAKATWHSYKILPIPPSLIQTSGYGSNQKSDNIISSSNKKVVFGIPVNIALKVVSSMNVFVETDCTKYTLRWRFVIKNLSTGEIVKHYTGDIGKKQSSLATANLLAYNAYERYTDTDYIYCEFELLNSSGGTFLYFHIPYLETTR